MMMKPTLKSALLAAAILFSQVAAHAGELTLYSHDSFHGREVTLREVTPDLVALGFNDKASSMVVRSGRWEVCVDAEFRGTCAVFEPGEYPDLNRFNNNISSVREVGRPWHGGGQERGPRGMVELFTESGLHGNSTRIVRDTQDFVQIGFNDRTYSIQIDAGTWQLCSDSEYRGICRIFGPGRYNDLGNGLTGQVSSARLVDERAAPRPDGGAVELFTSSDFGGDRLPLRRDAHNLSDFNFNDRAGSIIVNEGEWEFCLHADFGGRCVVYGPGRYPRLGWLDHQLSSVRRVR
ncbi:hypothetical protein AAKU55_005001 [Oxalobacteraceae bacterium GrIS 1.11]